MNAFNLFCGALIVFIVLMAIVISINVFQREYKRQNGIKIDPPKNEIIYTQEIPSVYDYFKSSDKKSSKK